MARPSSKYSGFSKEQLISKIEKLEKKNYGLIWEDKPEDVVATCSEKLPVLKEIAEKEIKCNLKLPVNYIIEGDNYHALCALNFTHEKKIDIIYIDPPYNTGNKSWKYNNAYVDKDDSFRHSKWLSFMDKRLQLAKNLLAENGIICVTIDDYECPNLWLLMNKIFGYENHLGTVVIRNNPKGRMTERKFSLVHEYAIFFGKSQNSEIKKLKIDPSEKRHKYKQDSDGCWYLPVNLRKQGIDSNAVNKNGVISPRFYPIYFDPKTGIISTKRKLPVKIEPIDNKGEKRIWRRGEEVIDEMYKNGDIWIKKVKNKYQLYYKFRGGIDGMRPQTIWAEPQFSASDYGTKILDMILGEREKFQYPKAPAAIKQSILSMSNKKDAIILDFFAGSGTTGHAVLELNKEDGGNRQFILCTNNENNICEEITYPRIKNVIMGYADKQGIPANVRYFKTDFVPVVTCDQDKRFLINQCTELLCIAENTFEPIIKRNKNNYAIFKNKDKQMAIIYDEESIKKCVDYLNKNKQGLMTIIYVFSYDNTYDENDFSELFIGCTIRPIPEAILNVYRQMFKRRKK
jgi:adenine-specific DNA-methyltransferase